MPELRPLSELPLYDQDAEYEGVEPVEPIELIGNTDAQVWAATFVKMIKENPEIPADEGTMIGWFANAIMAGMDSKADPLNRLADECYSTAVAKGFWDVVEERYLDNAMSGLYHVGLAARDLESLRKDRPADRPFGYHELQTLDRGAKMSGLKLLLIISEAVEAFEALIHEPEKADEEVADILIRLLDYAAARGINLDAIVAAKMEKNAGRPRKHGCNF